MQLMEYHLRTPYNYDVNMASTMTALRCNEPTMAQQQYRDECDINTIMRRFSVTGELPTTGAIPRYEDYTGVVNDYQTAMNALIEADKVFASLPSQVRRRFENDPQQFLEFCTDENNREEAIRLGLTEPKPKTEVQSSAPAPKPASTGELPSHAPGSPSSEKSQPSAPPTSNSTSRTG